MDTPEQGSVREALKKAAGKAFVKKDEEDEGGSGTDYNAVIRRYESKVKNPRTAIRARCIQCCNGQLKEVQLCPVKDCALHPFRMGENPFNLRTKAKNAGMSLEDYKAKHGLAGDDDGDDADEA